MDERVQRTALPYSVSCSVNTRASFWGYLAWMAQFWDVLWGCQILGRLMGWPIAGLHCQLTAAVIFRAKLTEYHDRIFYNWAG